MKKFISILLCVFIILSFTIVPVSAAPAPKASRANSTIIVTKVVVNESNVTINDTTEFSVTLYKDNVFYSTGIVSQGSPFRFTKLPAGTYTLTESETAGYSIDSPKIVTVNGKNSSTITVINKKLGSVPPDDPPDDPPLTTSFHYVALGDSLATGTTSRGKTTSYIYGFYTYLKTIYPSETMKDLSNDGDKAETLLGKLKTDAFIGEVSKANFITICIGGNNVLNAARDSYFSRIDTALAEAGTLAFERDYPLIIAEIRKHNETAKIVSMTLYNPYNSIDISGYRGDAALHIQAKAYIDRINNKIIGISDDNYKVADVYSKFFNDYGKIGKMGSITYFYPISLFKITRDPHPNQTGQNIMRDIHISAFKTF